MAKLHITLSDLNFPHCHEEKEKKEEGEGEKLFFAKSEKSARSQCALNN